MKHRRFFLGAGFLAAIFGATVSLSQSPQPSNPAAPVTPDLLSLGGAVTEIVYALGQGDRLLARDSTSTWPAAALDLPNVGYVRALSPEGVLSVGPKMILSAEGAGPKEALDVIKAADVDFVEIPEGYDGQAIATKITTVGAALGVSARAEALAREVQVALDSAAANAAAHTGTRKRVLFVLSAQGGKLTVGGQNSSADALISLAGGINAAQGFDGYKPMSDEAALAAAPDVVVMMRRGDHSLTPEELFVLPSLALTPAADARALIYVDGLKALTFGPRTAEAVTELTQALYEE